MLYYIQTLPGLHHSYILEGLEQVDFVQVGLEHMCGHLYVGGCACVYVCVELKCTVQYTGN
jgi:hypothetical protein